MVIKMCFNIESSVLIMTDRISRSARWDTGKHKPALADGRSLVDYFRNI